MSWITQPPTHFKHELLLKLPSPDTMLRSMLFSCIAASFRSAEGPPPTHPPLAIESHRELPKDTKMASGHPTAAQRVLGTGELVGEIMFWLAQSGDRERYPPIRAATPSPIACLASCARVNSMWFGEAIRLLWSRFDDPSDSRTFSLPQIMAGLEESRRQFYANFITHASLIDVQKTTVRGHNETLRTLTFPRLKYVSLILDHARPLLCLPTIHMPALKKFNIRFGSIVRTNMPSKFHVDYLPCYQRRRQMIRKRRTQTFPLCLLKRRLTVQVARMMARQVQVSCVLVCLLAPGIVANECAWTARRDSLASRLSPSARNWCLMSAPREHSRRLSRALFCSPIIRDTSRKSTPVIAASDTRGLNTSELTRRSWSWQVH